jgi:hypothetical protein
MTLALLTTSSLGCGTSGSSSTVGPAEHHGRISLAVTNAPPDATCIQVLVKGTKNVERDVDVAPGASTVLLVEGLPEGLDTITVNAFAGSCGALTPMSIPTWIGDPVTVMVTPDPVSITVNLHPNPHDNGRVSIGVNFDTDGGTDAAAPPDAGTTEPDTGTTEPDAGTTEPDAGTTEPDTGTTEPDAGTTEPDTGATEPDAGTTEPDAGTTEPDAGSPEPDAGPDVPPPPPNPLFVKSPDCLACAQAFCADAVDGCSTITGSATQGPAAGTPRSQLCNEALSCELTTNCGVNNPADCYCGTASGVACFNVGSANGACRPQVEAGLETSDPGTVVLNFTNQNYASGRAFFLVQCLLDNLCDSCF